MGIELKLLKKAHELNRRVHENARDYHNRNPLAVVDTQLILPTYQTFPFRVVHDLKDVLVVGALTQSSVLMTGKTDCGKTTLAKLVMNGLFGKQEDGWHRIDIDTDFGKDSVADTDFSIITEGKKISEGLYTAQGFLTLPGLIADEINRTHPAIANKLLHVFDKDITLPNGTRVKLGQLYAEGKTYQFQIAAINEGANYSGTFGIDEALRRRTTIEIPMNVFRPTAFDKLLIQRDSNRQMLMRNEANYFPDVLEIHKYLEQGLPIHPTAEMFISYLAAFDFCKNSQTGDKSSVEDKSGSVRHVCNLPVNLGGQQVTGATMGCEFLRTFPNELCPHVKGISEGISTNLKAVAAGFALLRATKFTEMLMGSIDGKTASPLSYAIPDGNADKLKDSLRQYVGSNVPDSELYRRAIERYASELEIGIEDVCAAFDFVGYSKVGLAPMWVSKHFQGNRYAALGKFKSEAREKFQEGLSEPCLQDLVALKEGKVTQETAARIKTYCDVNNPWLWRAVAPYLQEDKPASTLGKLDQIYGV
ncbi:hypothetical protein J4217_02285 [Candidatus Pacearchaeota archaeon]|nr:hypothetical protein [Candidatus Pacearchaeota archaeon]